MMEICYPEYGHCIANLACSILHFYGIQPPNPTLCEADELLRRKYKNVVLLLLDGLGTSTLVKHLTQEGFFRQNLRCSFSSTFPPTTVAATTAVMSGLYPSQSAWLGWTGYFDELDRNVVYFTNKDNDTGEKIEGIHAANTFVPFVNIRNRIEAAGVPAYWLTSWVPPFPKNYKALCSEIERLCAMGGQKFIYAYWEEPDNTMHKKGVLADETHVLLQEIEAGTEWLANQLQDTLLLITADHGLIDAQTVLLCDNEAIMECLIRPPSMEARALNLFVKEDRKEHFEQLFRQYYGNCYQLFTMEEVMSHQLFGCKPNHPRLHRMLGNYLAIATGAVALRMKNKKFIGEHAGLTIDEMTIPLIAIEKH